MVASPNEVQLHFGLTMRHSHSGSAGFGSSLQFEIKGANAIGLNVVPKR